MTEQPDFTKLINLFSTVSKLSKETVKEHKEGLKALQRISKTFEHCDDAARSGDPEKIQAACQKLSEIIGDFSNVSTSSAREATLIQEICNECTANVSGASMAPQTPALRGYA